MIRQGAPLAALLLIVAACATADQGTAEGLVTRVDGDLTEVRSFAVLTEDGERTFVPAEDGDFAFPLPHLGEHLRSGEPVVVFWEDRDGTAYAVGLDDADPDAH